MVGVDFLNKGLYVCVYTCVVSVSVYISICFGERGRIFKRNFFNILNIGVWS